MPKVAIVMGSKSDLPIMEKAQTFLSEITIETTIHIASAHRTPNKVHQLAKDINKQYDVVIAGAGMAAHLAGVIASLTIKPVIGVPINASLNGLDSLLSIAQMPPGIPVATVAINGAKNAAILAAQIIALRHSEIEKKLQKFRQSFQDI